MSGVCTNLRLKAMQRQIDSASPGPSAHVPQLGFVQHAAPAYSIGLASRGSYGLSAGPGPADYQDPLRMSTVVGVHMEDSRLRGVQGAVIGTSVRGSPTAQGGAGSPGPGAYSPQAYAAQRSPVVAFGRDRRDHSGEGGEGVPGPGAHSPELGFTLGASPRQPMGTAARFQGGSSEGVPGPGQYSSHLVDGITGKSVSSSRPQSARALIGTAQRPSLGAGSLSPGPAYSPSTTQTLPSSPGYSVGRAARDGGLSPRGSAGEAPGPGRYAAEHHDAATRPVSPRQPIGSAARFRYPSGGQDGEGLVGPGAYMLDTRAPTPGGAIGTAKRPDLGGRGLGEGPGVAYAHTAASAAVRPRSASAVFGLDPRFRPSPGARGAEGGGPSAASYSVSYAATQPSPSRTLIGRASRGGLGSGGSGEGSPGPGAYAVERFDALGAMSSSSARPNAPRQRIGSAPRRDGSASSTSPGPVYSPNTAFVLPRSAGFAMPRSPRDPQWSGAAGPGPGEYGTADGGEAVLPSSPHVRIGTAERFARDGDRDAPAPGPGAYVLQGCVTSLCSCVCAVCVLPLSATRSHAPLPHPPTHISAPLAGTITSRGAH